MAETSDHLKILIERPYLRPYFYENKAWIDGDVASLNEVKAFAELELTTSPPRLFIRPCFRNIRCAALKRRSGFICVTVLPCGIFLWKASTDSSLPAWPWFV